MSYGLFATVFFSFLIFIVGYIIFGKMALVIVIGFNRVVVVVHPLVACGFCFTFGFFILCFGESSLGDDFSVYCCGKKVFFFLSAASVFYGSVQYGSLV